MKKYSLIEYQFQGGPERESKVTVKIRNNHTGKIDVAIGENIEMAVRIATERTEALNVIKSEQKHFIDKIFLFLKYLAIRILNPNVFGKSIKAYIETL